MERYEDHPWCIYSDRSGGETDEEHRHDTYLSRVRSRSNSRSRHRNSFLVDELDMLMDKAATTIQAAWRGYLVRKRLWSENKAASTIQAAWRHFITKEYMTMHQDQLPSWQRYGHRRRTPSPVSSEDGRLSWEKPVVGKETAAKVIQAHYRGFATRRVLSQCSQAATTIQAHWRGYRTRQDLSKKRDFPQPCTRTKPCYAHRRSMARTNSTVVIYPRKHWQKTLVGTPREWRSKMPTQFSPRKEYMEPPPPREDYKEPPPPKEGYTEPPPPREEYTEPPPKPKSCPKCGRCTTVRVLEGVGKGPRSESELDDSEYEGTTHHPSAPSRSRQRSPGSRLKRQKSPRRSTCTAHVSYQMSSQGPASEDQSRRPGTGGISQRYASHPTPRPSKERATGRSLSSTSVHQQGAPSPGTSEWLYENYCAHRMGEGQRRVFKTRKHMWEVARAATCIQAFWRGWKARQALRQQENAAIRIQSAYRGYKTRVYLIDAGILSEGDTTD